MLERGQSSTSRRLMIVQLRKVVAPDELFDDEIQRHLHYPAEKGQLETSITSSTDDILLIYV